MKPHLHNEHLELSISPSGLSLLRKADRLDIFRNARIMIFDYRRKVLVEFPDEKAKIPAATSGTEARFRAQGDHIALAVALFLHGSELQYQATLTNLGSDDLELGDVCLLHWNSGADFETHLLQDEIDVFSLGAISGATMEPWSKDPGSKNAFALRLSADGESCYKTDNILALRPVNSFGLTPEVTLGFDRIAEAACGFTIDLKERVASARVALRGTVLPAGQSRVLPTLSVDGVRPVHEALEAIVDRVAALYHPPITPRVATGWCSWYYYYAKIREEDILDNLRWLAQNRDRFPYEFVQIDDGYQLHWGDWHLHGTKFPHDMAYLAKEIAKLGFKPGIWVAPMIMTVQSNLFRDHPDWAMRRHDTGENYTLEGWSGPHENPWVIIDGTNPGFLEHIKQLFRTLAHDWGYDYFKLDAAAFGAYDGIRHDRTKTGVQAVRLVMEAIREAIGPGKYILGCGVPFGSAVGVVNGQRVSDDVSTAFRSEQFGCSMELALPQSIHKSLIQGKWGHNDPDCVLVRSKGTPHEAKISESGLPLEEARFFITVIGLTQGIQMVGENMMELEPERLALLDAILPVMPWPAQPLDLFSAKPKWLLTRTPHGLLLGLFNWTMTESTELVPWSALGLPEVDSREVFELWTAGHLGRAKGSLDVAIPAQGCRLLFLRTAQDRPTFLALDGHVSCGSAFFNGESWDEQRHRLTIRFHTGRAGTLFFICPPSYRPSRVDAIHSGSMWSVTLDSRETAVELEFQIIGH